MLQLLESIVFEDCQNQWSLSRPLMCLIMLQPEQFEQVIPPVQCMFLPMFRSRQLVHQFFRCGVECVGHARDLRVFSQCKSKIVSEVTVSVGCELLLRRIAFEAAVPCVCVLWFD
jgi:hypothetical protein